MAWNFGDSFDLYAAVGDAVNGYWDSQVSTTNILVTGRFAGSQAFRFGSGGSNLVKSSGVNDPVHHFAVSFNQTTALGGTTDAHYFILSDGATAQCSVYFRSDGAIVLCSGGIGGTTLDTYTGAFTTNNAWYGFEIEMVINNTTGSWAVRKNGNSVNDHSATGLNTRGGTANNYANKLTIQSNQPNSVSQYFDDLFWRSGAAAGAWLGDLRCYTRMPASDQSIQFTRGQTTLNQAIGGSNNNLNISANQAWYTPFTSSFDGTLGSASFGCNQIFTGNIKAAIYAASGGLPTTVLATSNVLTNMVVGSPGTNVITFPSPPTVTKGTQYFLSVCASATNGLYVNGNDTAAFYGTTTYASFPVASPGSLTSGQGSLWSQVTVTISSNVSEVSEARQDGLTSYIYDSNPGDADFYTIGSIGSTPATVIATTVRGYMQKSDAGTRSAAIQLKSGATTVATPTMGLSPSGFQWAWRIDINDPNTGAAWTAAGVNNVQIGPTVVA